jgi:Cu+-exporting ATPase
MVVARQVIHTQVASTVVNSVAVPAIETVKDTSEIGAGGDGVTAEVIGALSVRDPIKPGAKKWIDVLKKQGLKIVLLSGDRHETVSVIARELGIEQFYGQVLPEGKQLKVRELKAAGEKVAFAGDGINDAPALAEADVGVAMGTGSDIAIESADLTLVGGDLLGFLRARQLSRAVIRNIKQNLVFAFMYNSVGVPLAAGLLYPLTGTLLSPMIASAAMSLSSVSVIANSLRLRRVKFRD